MKFLHFQTCSVGRVRCTFWFMDLGVSMKFNPTESMLLENFIVYTLSYGIIFSTYSYYRIDEIHKRQENQNCFLHQS